MPLSPQADIAYKTNWQQGALKVQRHNKWVCEMKQALKDVGIFGPAGDPTPPPDVPIKYTLVPYEEDHAEPSPLSRQTSSDHATAVDSSFATQASERLDLGRSAIRTPAPAYSFVDRENILQDPSQDVHNEDVRPAPSSLTLCWSVG
jgi:hypothetical protein